MTKNKAKAIMIQGTMSNAGKSILVSGLCRIFAQDGYRAAPFKSQNMALNSYITAEGLEMGRAQAVQAEAAGILPAADMNPILLKPTTDVGSQVIVNGISRGNMKAKDYFACKKDLVPDILAAYNRLAGEYDIIVIEGAGSPAEINLKEGDIVNMGMASMADAPVLLAGDIDRGGVFAQLYGTVALLTEEERARIQGLIINKFRGDKTILDPGCIMLEDLCGIPVVGVVPYMDIDIEDEDSLSSRLEHSGGKAGKASSGACGQEQGTEAGLNGENEGKAVREIGAKAGLDLAVIRFPRISNFTDFNVFSTIPGVSLRYVSRLSQLGSPDMLFLPGTKNTIEDLLWMRQNGLEAAALKLAGRQTPVWGICGGYQMMGEWLRDKDGVETQAGREIRGMGLLPLKTEFYKEKTRTRAEGSFGQLDGCLECLSGLCLSGYEIHMGRTFIDRENGAVDTAHLTDRRAEPEICRPLAYLMEVRENQGLSLNSKLVKTDGWNRGDIYGSYVHGIFDGAGVARALVKALAEKKGLAFDGLEHMDYKAYREQQYDKLAKALRESLDMKRIYKMMGLDGDL